MILEHPYTEQTSLIFPLSKLHSVKEDYVAPQRKKWPKRNYTKDIPKIFKAMIMEHLLQHLFPLSQSVYQIKKTSQMHFKIKNLIQNCFFRLQQQAVDIRIKIKNQTYEGNKRQSVLQTTNATSLRDLDEKSECHERKPSSKEVDKQRNLLMNISMEAVDTLVNMISKHSINTKKYLALNSNKSIPKPAQQSEKHSQIFEQISEVKPNLKKSNKLLHPSTKTVRFTDEKQLQSLQVIQESAKPQLNTSIKSINSFSQATPKSSAQNIKEVFENMINKQSTGLQGLQMSSDSLYKIGLLRLCSVVKSKIQRLKLFGFFNIKQVAARDDKEEAEERCIYLKHSLIMLNQSLQKDEHIIELHQQLQEKCQQIEHLQEQVLLYRRMMKMMALQKIQQHVKEIKKQVFQTLRCKYLINKNNIILEENQSQTLIQNEIDQGNDNVNVVPCNISNRYLQQSQYCNNLSLSDMNLPKNRSITEIAYSKTNIKSSNRMNMGGQIISQCSFSSPSEGSYSKLNMLIGGSKNGLDGLASMDCIQMD